MNTKTIDDSEPVAGQVQRAVRQHTPGPWSLATVPTSVGSCHKIGPFPNGDRVATFACVYADGHRLGIDDKNQGAVELAANARLIAAAPDLFAALEGLLRAVQRSVCEGSGPAQEAAHAALHKAAGAA